MGDSVDHSGAADRSDSSRQTLELTKLREEIDYIRAQRSVLQRRFWAKTGFWIGFVGVVVGLYGTFGERALARAEIATAQYRADRAIDAARLERQEAEEAKAAAETAVREAQEQIAALTAQISAATLGMQQAEDAAVAAKQLAKEREAQVASLERHVAALEASISTLTEQEVIAKNRLAGTMEAVERKEQELAAAELRANGLRATIEELSTVVVEMRETAPPGVQQRGSEVLERATTVVQGLPSLSIACGSEVHHTCGSCVSRSIKGGCCVSC